MIGFVASGGARMDDGIAALGGYGRIFRENVALSGRVPQISVITGVSAGGGAYSPALTDFVVMTEGSAMFLTGPGVVREVMGEDVDAQELGGPKVHASNGVCQFVAANDHEAVGAGARPARPPAAARRRARRRTACPHRCRRWTRRRSCPDAPRKVYDVRDVIRAIVDDGGAARGVRRAGRATWSRRSAGSTAARSA